MIGMCDEMKQEETEGWWRLMIVDAGKEGLRKPSGDGIHYSGLEFSQILP